jgi:predicted HD superfamily hydrolase involved in NAD metabolism
MAEQFGISRNQAHVTGLLHDYAKGIAGSELLILAADFGIPLTTEDRLLPDLLHGPVGAKMLEHDVGITDSEMLSAIAAHTLGSLRMSTLDKIIFLADMIEPGRDYPMMDRLSCLCERDLDAAMLFALDITIRYCLDQARILHPRTIAVRNRFLSLLPEPVVC